MLDNQPKVTQCILQTCQPACMCLLQTMCKRSRYSLWACAWKVPSLKVSHIESCGFDLKISRQFIFRYINYIGGSGIKAWKVPSFNVSHIESCGTDLGDSRHIIFRYIDYLWSSRMLLQPCRPIKARNKMNRYVITKVKTT